mgnify:FL=1
MGANRERNQHAGVLLPLTVAGHGAGGTFGPVPSWRSIDARPRTAATRELWDDVRSRQPRFTRAVAADARMAARHRGERPAGASRLDVAVQVARLCLVTDAFLGQCCYRAKVGLQRRDVPFLPRLLHRLAVTRGQIAIGDPVVVAPGVFIPHGQVVVDGITTIGARSVIGPFTTIGLVAGQVVGPTLGERVRIGTGVRVLGPVTLGDDASVGANAVVVDDVPAGTTVVGIPARPLGRGTDDHPEDRPEDARA